MIAVSTIPPAWLERFPLRTWPVSSLYIVPGLKVWLVASLCDTLSLRFLILVTHVL